MGSIYHNGNYYGGGSGSGGIIPDMDTIILKDGRAAINFDTEFTKSGIHTPTTGMVAEALETQIAALKEEVFALRAKIDGYGLAKTTDVTTVTNKSNGLVLPATEKNPNIENSLAYQIAQLKGIQGVQELVYPLATNINLVRNTIPDYKLTVSQTSLVFGMIGLYVSQVTQETMDPGYLWIHAYSGDDIFSGSTYYYTGLSGAAPILQLSLIKCLNKGSSIEILMDADSYLRGKLQATVNSAYSKARYFAIPIE